MEHNIRKSLKATILKALAITVSLFYYSCNQRNETEKIKDDYTSFYLQKVNSIQIDRETPIRVLDFNPKNNRFLAYDKITEEFLIINEHGEILDSIYRVGEGPNEYSSNLLAASFNYEGDGYFALSSREFIWYNENWNVKTRIRFVSHVQKRFYSGPKFRVPYFRSPDTSLPYFFTNFLSGSSNFIEASDQNHISSKFLIEEYNPHKDSLEWKLPFETEMIPQYESNQNDRGAAPVQVFALDGHTNTLYLTFDRSKEICEYDLSNGFKLKKKINFDHENFHQNNNSKIKALFSFDSKKLVILHFKGLSEVLTAAKKSDDPNYSSYKDPSLYRLIVVDDNVKQVVEIEFPLNCDPSSEIIQLPTNRILLRDKHSGEEEPEYSTYSIFELKSQPR